MQPSDEIIAINHYTLQSFDWFMHGKYLSKQVAAGTSLHRTRNASNIFAKMDVRMSQTRDTELRDLLRASSRQVQAEGVRKIGARYCKYIFNCETQATCDSNAL